MVCLGNICRSPMAQGVLESLLEKYKLHWQIDSAGTNGFHNGEAPDPRAIKAIGKRGIDISRQISRKIRYEDLDEFDLLLAMDETNLHYLNSMCKNDHQKNKLKLLLAFNDDPKFKNIPDPYYDNSFDHALDLIEKACESLVANIQKH